MTAGKAVATMFAFFAYATTGWSIPDSFKVILALAVNA
jgi:hypothetical protein